MSDVAAYHVLVCTLFPVQVGMCTLARNSECFLKMICDMLSKHVGA